MKNDVSPLTAALVLSLLGVFIWAVFSLNQRALSVDRISLMAPHPDGSAVVLMGNNLYQLGPEGHSEKVISLGELGISSTLGGFGFFSDGDLLVLATELAPSLLRNLSVLNRTENENYTETGKSRLLRCKPEQRACREFTTSLPDFDRTFRVFIDHPSDTVYVADTSRHRLIKLDSKGKQLAIKSGFRFPNQLRLIDGELWATDTNHHQVVRVEPGDDGFGSVVERHRTYLPFGRTWPSDLAGVGEQRWVLVMNNDMRDGVVARFDHGGQLIGTLRLPRGADPMALLIVDGEVLVSDYSRFTLYRFDRAGERLTRPAYPRLKAALDEAHHRYRYYKLLWLGCWTLFAIAVSLGIFYAFKVIPEEYTPVAVKPASRMAEIPEEGIWLKTSLLLRITRSVLVVLMAVSMIMLLGAAVVVKSALPPEVYLALALLFAVAIPIEIIVTRQLRCKLGIFPDVVIFVNSEGFQFEAPYGELAWSEGFLKIGPNVIAIPYRLRRGLFPVKAVKTLLVPRLDGSRHISPMLMAKYHLLGQPGLLKLGVAVLAAIGLVLLYSQVSDIL